MSELLTARDVELKSFKKVSFGGYAIQEVEDFLNQVADDLEAYVLRIDERDAKIHDLEEYVRKQESMTDMIKNALIQAQKAAKDMEEQANEQKAKILSQARIEAENKIEEAKEQAADITARARISADNIIKEAEERINVTLAPKLEVSINKTSLYSNNGIVSVSFSVRNEE